MRELQVTDKGLSIKLRLLQPREMYSTSELESLEIYDENLAFSEGVIRNEEGKYLGASIIEYMRRINGMDNLNSNDYIDLFSLAVAIDSEVVVNLAHSKDLIREVQMGRHKVEVIPYENLHYFSEVGRNIENIDKMITRRSLDEMIQNLPDVRIPLESLKYISENKDDSNSEIAAALKEDEETIILAKHNLGIKKMDGVDILAVTRKFDSKNNENEKIINEDLENKIFLNDNDLSYLKICKEDINPNSYSKSEKHDISEINSSMYYKITHIMGLTGMTSLEIKDAINNNKIKFQIIKYTKGFGEKDEDSISLTGAGETTYSNGTFLIKGSEIINYIGDRKLFATNFERRRSRRMSLTNAIEEDAIFYGDRSKPDEKDPKGAIYKTKRGDFGSLLIDEAGGRYVELLTKKEEQELGKRIQNGDALALEDLIEANVRLVVKTAKKYMWGKRHLKFADLISEGLIGLSVGAIKYDPDFRAKKEGEPTSAEDGYKFGTFGLWWIRQAITRSIPDKEFTIRKPVNVHEVENKVARFHTTFYQSNRREPTTEEVCIGTGISKEKIKKIRNSVYREVTSLDAPMPQRAQEDGGDYWHSVGDKRFNPEDEIFQKTLARKIREILAEVNLDKREARIISQRFGIENEFNLEGDTQTLEQIGKREDVTRERIRQLEKKALDKIKKHPKFQKLGELVKDELSERDRLDIFG